MCARGYFIKLAPNSAFPAWPAVGWLQLDSRDVHIPAFTASAALVTRVNLTNTTVVNRAYVTNALHYEDLW